MLGLGTARFALDPPVLPIPELDGRDPWPRRTHDSLLHPKARSRIPSHTDWARGTFEQGALLPELPAVMPAVVLPGPKLFQANRVDPERMRPAVFHCFGKSEAKTCEPWL